MQPPVEPTSPAKDAKKEEEDGKSRVGEDVAGGDAEEEYDEQEPSTSTATTPKKERKKTLVGSPKGSASTPGKGCPSVVDMVVKNCEHILKMIKK